MFKTIAQLRSQFISSAQVLIEKIEKHPNAFMSSVMAWGEFVKAKQALNELLNRRDEDGPLTHQMGLPRKNPVWETMTIWTREGRAYDNYRVRVWREVPECLKGGQDLEVLNGIELVKDRLLDQRNWKVFCEDLVEYLPSISAIEVLRDGQGVVYYPDWK